MNQFGKKLNWFRNKIEPIQKLNHNIYEDKTYAEHWRQLEHLYWYLLKLPMLEYHSQETLLWSCVVAIAEEQ